MPIITCVVYHCRSLSQQLSSPSGFTEASGRGNQILAVQRNSVSLGHEELLEMIEGLAL